MGKVGSTTLVGSSNLLGILTTTARIHRLPTTNVLFGPDKYGVREGVITVVEC